jgi:ribosomal protein L6P/L9E
MEVKGTKGVSQDSDSRRHYVQAGRRTLVAERASDDQAALHGLARALANNAIRA